MVEQIFKTGAQQIDHQYVVKALLTKVVHIRNARCPNISTAALETLRLWEYERQPTKIL